MQRLVSCLTVAAACCLAACPGCRDDGSGSDKRDAEKALAKAGVRQIEVTREEVPPYLTTEMLVWLSRIQDRHNYHNRGPAIPGERVSSMTLGTGDRKKAFVCSAMDNRLECRVLVVGWAGFPDPNRAAIEARLVAEDGASWPGKLIMQRTVRVPEPVRRSYRIRAGRVPAAVWLGELAGAPGISRETGVAVALVKTGEAKVLDRCSVGEEWQDAGAEAYRKYPVRTGADHDREILALELKTMGYYSDPNVLYYKGRFLLRKASNPSAPAELRAWLLEGLRREASEGRILSEFACRSVEKEIVEAMSDE